MGEAVLWAEQVFRMNCAGWRMVEEGRRYRFGFVILDQLPGLLSRYVLENCATKGVHRLEPGSRRIF